MFVRRKGFVEVLQVPAWVITSDFYLHDTSQLERTQSWFWHVKHSVLKRGTQDWIKSTLALKGDGRPASVLPLSSWPSGSAWALYKVCAPALAKQIATNFNCLCIHLLTPNALQPHPPIPLPRPRKWKSERREMEGERRRAYYLFSGLL